MLEEDTLLKKYLNWLEEKHPTSYKNYKSTALYFKEVTGKQLLKIVSDDINKFFIHLEEGNYTPKSFNNNYRWLNKLIKYLKTNHIINFSLKDLGIKTYTKEEEEEGASYKSTPFTFKEIIIIRELLEDYPILSFTFEVSYSYGLTLHELANCNKNNYDFITRQFKFKSKDGIEKEIYIGEMIHEILLKDQRILEPKKPSTYQKHFARIEKLLQTKKGITRNVNWQDVEATRKRNFFNCPECQELVEVKPENWVVVEYNTEKNRWFICRTCSIKY